MSYKLLITIGFTNAVQHIVQNSGGVKLQRSNSLRVLVRKMFGIWQDKILVNDVCFAKFATKLSRQNFAVYGNN